MMKRIIDLPPAGGEGGAETPAGGGLHRADEQPGMFEQGGDHRPFG